MIEFAFGNHGRVFLPINIKPLNGITMSPVDFKVDTGADFTTISKVHLQILGYSKVWINQNIIMTKGATVASGDQVRTGVVQMPIINILGYEAHNWPFLIMADDDKDFRNLLGRDLLSGFNYTFNNDDDIFQITRALGFKRRSEFMNGQEIHATQKKG